MSDTVAGLLREVAHIGADPIRGGYTRPVYSPAELDLREWFLAHAVRRGLEVETDRNGALWAWHAPGGRRDGAVVTGSHLDSVPGGGAYDGPLGVASALVAFDLLAQRGAAPERPRAIAVFPEEEGSRFGVACLGSRLMVGAIDPDRVRALRDPDGDTFADIAGRRGLDPTRIGPDPSALGRIDTFVELHIEQGRALVDLDRPMAVASSILGHGRWRLTLHGVGNHAGTTLMADRSDPMVAAGQLVVRIRDLARRHPGARATVGRLTPTPGATNVIASRVDLWVDVRHPEDAVTAALVDQIRLQADIVAAEEGCTATMVEESFSARVDFDAGLRDRLRDKLSGRLGDVPVIATGAGHDAGVLKRHVPTAMLFVRNPTGVSHAPPEQIDDDDAEIGAVALADALEELLTGEGGIPPVDGRS